MIDHTPRPCSTCGTEFVPLTNRQRLCHRRCRRKGEATCDWCGHVFQRNNAKQATCSKSCGQRMRYLPAPTLIPWASCLNCRRWFVARRGNKVCCKPDTIKRTCIGCGQEFTYRPTSGPRRSLCSKRCKDMVARRNIDKSNPNYRARRKRHKQARRARLKGANVERFKDIDIFERDNWRCGICGAKTKRDAKVPDHRAPTLDHLIPLAQGGDHVPSNVQCACFICNTIKGDRTTARGDQLRLVG